MDPEKIQAVLEDLLKFEDVYACMVAKQGMEGVVPDKSKFSPKVLGIIETLQTTIDNEFQIIKQYSDYGLGEMSFRLQDFEVRLYVLPGSEIALIAITPSQANRGLVEVTLENARRKLIEIIKA